MKGTYIDSLHNDGKDLLFINKFVFQVSRAISLPKTGPSDHLYHSIIMTAIIVDSYRDVLSSSRRVYERITRAHSIILSFVYFYL